MIVHAELNCLNCGYEIGDIEGQRGAPVEDLLFLPVHQGDVLVVDDSGRFRCPRCRGSVLPQGVAPVNRPLDRESVFEGDLSEELRPVAS